MGKYWPLASAGPLGTRNENFQRGTSLNPARESLIRLDLQYTPDEAGLGSEIVWLQKLQTRQWGIWHASSLRSLLPSECLRSDSANCASQMTDNLKKFASGSLASESTQAKDRSDCTMQWTALAKPELAYHIRSCRLHVASSTSAMHHEWECTKK